MARRTAPPKPRDVITLADLAPRHTVVGGSERRVFGADVPAATSDAAATRGARPAKKDLPAGKDVKGGRKIR
jgi:hypothetical protein